MKNKYLIYLIVMVSSFLLINYFYLWKSVIPNNNTNRYNKISELLFNVSYNELDSYLNENKDIIMYVDLYNSYSNDEFNDFFYNFINDNNYIDDLLYLYLNNDKEKEILLDLYDIKNESFPLLISFKNQKINNIYSISKNFNDFDKIELFIRSEINYD